jgi:hypothetical protein
MVLLPVYKSETMRVGRWREASAGVDRRAQLDQASHARDRHGLGLPPGGLVVSPAVVRCRIASGPRRPASRRSEAEVG